MIMRRDKRPALPHGDNDRYIGQRDFVRLFGDYFDTLLYEKLRANPQPLTFDRTYTDDAMFWKDVINDRNFQSMHVLLKSFHLTEWLPTAPGRYFTSEASQARLEAQQYKYGKKEYYPLG